MTTISPTFLYEAECQTIRNKKSKYMWPYVHLSWMHGVTKEDRIRNWHTRKELSSGTIEDGLM